MPHALTGGGVSLNNSRLHSGFLTAADSRFFPAVMASAMSTVAQAIPYVVVNHGLTEEQVQLLEKWEVEVIPDGESLSRSLSEIASSHRTGLEIAYRAWHKPLVCERSPFDFTVWVDADAVILDDAREVVDCARSFVTRDHFVNDKWCKESYRSIVESICGELPERFAEVRRINAGVFGFWKGDKWLAEWRELCQRVIESPELIRQCDCMDQSVLVALLSRSPEIELPIVENSAWNQPADYLMNTRRASRLACSSNPVELLQQAKKRHPDARIVHWMGTPKPWMLGE